MPYTSSLTIGASKLSLYSVMGVPVVMFGSGVAFRVAVLAAMSSTRCCASYGFAKRLPSIDSKPPPSKRSPDLPPPPPSIISSNPVKRLPFKSAPRPSADSAPMPASNPNACPAFILRPYLLFPLITLNLGNCICWIFHLQRGNPILHEIRYAFVLTHIRRPTHCKAVILSA